MGQLTHVEKSLQESREQIASIANIIGSLNTIDELKEARARIEAVKAWAKAHKKLAEVRLDLLRVEVFALIRVANLGGLDELPKADREAASWFADLAPELLEEFISGYAGAANTASGLYRALTEEGRREQQRRASYFLGRNHASSPSILRDLSDDIEERRYSVNIGAVMREVVESVHSWGRPFTVDEIAETVLQEAAVDVDDDMRRGVAEVCREAIRREPHLELDGYSLPSTITALTEDGYIRVPVKAASVWHLKSMIEGRRVQIEQDEARLAQLESVLTRLEAIPGCKDESRIGLLILGSAKARLDERDAA